MLLDSFTVESPNVTYTEEHITSSYEYDTTELERGPRGDFTVRPVSQRVEFQTERRVPKVGCAAARTLLRARGCAGAQVCAPAAPRAAVAPVGLRVTTRR